MNETQVAGKSNELAIAKLPEAAQKVEVVLAGELGGGGRLELADLEKLPAEQRTAMGWLRMGKSMPEAAKLAGVSRATIYRWKAEDALFRAFYNHWQHEMHDECRARMTRMLEKAAAALEKALDGGDAKAAMAVLKSLGFMKPAEPGPMDLEEVEWDLAQEERRKVRRMMEMERKALEG